MVVRTPEALSVKQELADPVKEIRQKILNLIPGQEIKPFFIRPHLKRELIIGLIGLRGDGKSGSGSTISLVDYGLRGVPIWSNMAISCDIEVDDITARNYGLKKGGVAHYESKELDKDALLKLDEQYMDSFIWIDEINVQYSNIRRFMSNTNVDFNTVVQELRKFHTSMGYSVIDEMFIDPQLRTLTDVFIKCEDTALSVEGLTNRKPTGVDFKWTIYPMSGYLAGRENSYYVTKKPLPPVFFHFAPWRGTYNTDLFQRKGVYSMNKREQEKAMKANIQVADDPVNVEQANKWGWLEERAILLKKSGIEYLESHQLWQVLKVNEHGYMPADISKLGLLDLYGITRHHQNRVGKWVYRIEQYDIDKIDKTDRESALAAV